MWFIQFKNKNPEVEDIINLIEANIEGCSCSIRIDNYHTISKETGKLVKVIGKDIIAIKDNEIGALLKFHPSGTSLHYSPYPVSFNPFKFIFKSNRHKRKEFIKAILNITSDHFGGEVRHVHNKRL